MVPRGDKSLVRSRFNFLENEVSFILYYISHQSECIFGYLIGSRKIELILTCGVPTVTSSRRYLVSTAIKTQFNALGGGQVDMMS